MNVKITVLSAFSAKVWNASCIVGGNDLPYADG